MDEQSSLRDRLIERAEIDAERAVSLVRLLVALMLAAVLAGAMALVPLDPPDVALRQVGRAWLVVGAFALLGAIAFRLARHGVFKPWMPWLFTTLDALLVILNIHTSLANVGIGPAYMTMFPAVWIAPLVLGFGVLRYRAGLQAYCGLLLLAGLAVLVFAHEGRAMTQLPHHLFQGPPNVARLTLFTMLIALLALAAYQRRRLLSLAIAEVERRSEYQRYLPPAIADLVAAGGIARLRLGWRTEAAVLLVDIRGFTRLSEDLPPRQLSGFVSAFRAQVSAAVAAHGGIVDKFVGDGAVALFGAVETTAGAPARALACATRLARAVDVIDGRPIRLAMGLHWGEVFAGAVGDDARLEFTVLGDTVNVAARLEELAKAEDRALVASSALLEAAGAKVEHGWLPLDATAVRGRAGTLRLYALS